VAETASARLSAAVQAALAPAARYAALVTRTNPLGSASQLLARPDIRAVLADALEQARQAAAAAVQDGWGAAPDSPVLGHLLEDITRQYGDTDRLRALVRAAHASVPPRQFTPGQSAPGSHPSAQAAAERSAAVRHAVLGFARDTALRSRLTLAVAQAAARTARTLAEGEDREVPGKRWKAHPERPTCCHWCRNLHGVTVGLHDSFLPYLGGPADLSGHGRLTQPPKPYRGMLSGPPLHPHCECELELVEQIETRPAETTERPRSGQKRPVFISAAEIRAMPEARYKGLAAFLHAALHELGQVIRRLVSRS
jgi:hypothetical protein